MTEKYSFIEGLSTGNRLCFIIDDRSKGWISAGTAGGAVTGSMNQLDGPPRKQRVNIMLDTGVIAFFKSKAGERGYQTLINAALKQAIQQEELETTLRRIVREELTNAR